MDSRTPQTGGYFIRVNTIPKKSVGSTQTVDIYEWERKLKTDIRSRLHFYVHKVLNVGHSKGNRIMNNFDTYIQYVTRQAKHTVLPMLCSMTMKQLKVLFEQPDRLKTYEAEQVVSIAAY